MAAVQNLYWYPEPPSPYKPYETAFARIFLLLENAGLLD